MQIYCLLVLLVYVLGILNADSTYELFGSALVLLIMLPIFGRVIGVW